MPAPDFQTVPRLRVQALPRAELDESWQLESLLHEMLSFIQRFEKAVKLVDFCEHNIADARQKWMISRDARRTTDLTLINKQFDDSRIFTDQMHLFGDWESIAARDAALTIWHYGKSLIATKTQLRKCATLRELVDESITKKATRLYNEYFPHSESMRNAVCHDAENTASIKKSRENSTKGAIDTPAVKTDASSSIIIKSGIGNRSLMYTHGGKMLTLTVDIQSLDKLIEINNLFYSAFRVAEEFMKQEARKPRRGNISSTDDELPR